MNLVFIDSPEGKRGGTESCVTPDGPPRDAVTRLPPTQQEDKQENQTEPYRGHRQLTHVGM